MIPSISSTLQEATLLSVTVWKRCIHMTMWWFLSDPHTYAHTHTCGHSHSSAARKLIIKGPSLVQRYLLLGCSNHLKPNSIVFRALKWVRGNLTIWAFSIQLHAPGFSFLSSCTLYSLSLFHSSFSLALSSFLSIYIFLSSISVHLCFSFFLSPSRFLPLSLICTTLFFFLPFLSLFQKALKETQASKLTSQNCLFPLSTGCHP